MPNLALVLRQLRDHGPRSRATLAAELGLTRSAVSSLVTDLAERGLVRIGGMERGSIGRPGTTVELDGHGICGLGAEINVNHVATMALDLAGEQVAVVLSGARAEIMREVPVIARLYLTPVRG